MSLPMVGKGSEISAVFCSELASCSRVAASRARSSPVPFFLPTMKTEMQAPQVLWTTCGMTSMTQSLITMSGLSTQMVFITLL